ETIRHGQRRAAKVFELARLVHPFGPRSRAPDDHTETEGLHRQGPLSSTASFFSARCSAERAFVCAAAVASRRRRASSGSAAVPRPPWRWSPIRRGPCLAR